MKRIRITLLVSLCLLIQNPQMATAAQPDPRKPEATVIYQVSTDGKTKKAIAQMPMMHRANISPSGRYVYTERIGYGKNDPTVPYLYDVQTKKLTQLNGFGKWSPKQDMLYVKEKGGIVRLSPLSLKKTVLVPGIPEYPVLDFQVSPDEQYMAFSREDRLASDSNKSTHLYLQHLPTLKMKINDRFAREKKGPHEDMFFWTPTSKKLFYRTKSVYKELDLPTGLKYEHKEMTDFPSYSSDMHYRYVRTQNEEYLLQLRDGKKVMLQKQTHGIREGYLEKLLWSPTGHRLVAEEMYRQSGNAQDTYMRIRYYQEAPRFVYPFGDVGKSEWSPYMSLHDNVRLIGWAKDGKSYFVADLASIHHRDYAPDKLDEYYRIIEQE